MSDSPIVRAVAEERLPANTSVREVMSEKVCYVFEDDDIDEAAKIMAEHQVKRLPVLNKDKRLVGIVALSDLGRLPVGRDQALIFEPAERGRDGAARKAR